ncbi:MAG: hypothetical protein ACOCTG_06135, partial [Bacteroidota bacterium]
MFHRNAFLFALLVFSGSLASASAQPHFDGCTSQTGNGAVLLLPGEVETNIGGIALEAGDEMGAFTPDGLCAGRITWEGRSGSMTIWGNNVMTPDKDGFDPGETLHFRIWQASTDAEFGVSGSKVSVTYDESQPYFSNSGTYSDGAIVVISSISADVVVLAGPALRAPADEATNVERSATLAWDP